MRPAEIAGQLSRGVGRGGSPVGNVVGTLGAVLHCDVLCCCGGSSILCYGLIFLANIHLWYTISQFHPTVRDCDNRLTTLPPPFSFSLALAFK
jgi:hypothetical protein